MDSLSRKSTHTVSMATNSSSNIVTEYGHDASTDLFQVRDNERKIYQQKIPVQYSFQDKVVSMLPPPPPPPPCGTKDPIPLLVEVIDSIACLVGV